MRLQIGRHLKGSVRSPVLERRNRLIKHYGPGPHPSGTDQSAHGGRSRQPMLDPEIFGPEPPTPNAKLTFTIQGPDNLPLPEMYEATTPIAREDELLVRHAVEDFERFLPGALPDNLEFRVANDDTGGASLAWVVPHQNVDNVVFISEQGFTDIEPILDAIGNYEDQPWTTAAGKAVLTGKTQRERVQLVKQLGVFHELAHITAIRLPGLTPRQRTDMVDWPDSVPFYGPRWYETKVSWNHPSLPSAYAANNPPEFFAEAVVDAWLNGEDAAPLSKVTVREVRRLIEKQS